MIRIIIYTLTLVFAAPVFGQEPVFSASGKQTRSFSFADTIIDTRQPLQTSDSTDFIFQKLDPQNPMVRAGGKLINVADYFSFEKSEWADYFILVNAGRENIVFTPQDLSLMTVKETMNDCGEWKPIEFWMFSGCGNSYFPEYSLGNGQILIIRTNRHRGNFVALQRMRFLTESKGVIVSAPYMGSCDPNEFAMGNENQNLMRFMRRQFTYLEK